MEWAELNENKTLHNATSSTLFVVYNERTELWERVDRL